MSIDLDQMSYEEYAFEVDKENVSPNLSRQNSKNQDKKNGPAINQRVPFSDLTEIYYPKKIQNNEDKIQRQRIQIEYQGPSLTRMIR